MTLGTKSHAKIAPISWREARRLERLVGRARRVCEGIRIDTVRRHSGTQSQSGLLAQRGGCKAGECSQRCLLPLRCALGTLTAGVAGTEQAFRVGAPPNCVMQYGEHARRAVRAYWWEKGSGTVLGQVHRH